MTTRQIYGSSVRRTNRSNQGTNRYNQGTFNDLPVTFNDYPTMSSSPRIRLPANNLTPYPAHVQHPSRDGLREARLDRFQGVYNHDKEIFKAKEEAKKQKKLEEKLRRYEGVGELGNRMTEEEVNEEQKFEGLWRARDSIQYQHENHANITLQRSFEDKAAEEELKQKKLEEGVGELGNKMTEGTVTQEDKSDELSRSREGYQLQNENQKITIAQQIRKDECRKSLECLTLGENSGESSTSGLSGQRLGGQSVNRVRGEHPLLAKLAVNNKQEQN